jgi:hypothetical protein
MTFMGQAERCKAAGSFQAAVTAGMAAACMAAAWMLAAACMLAAAPAFAQDAKVMAQNASGQTASAAQPVSITQPRVAQEQRTGVSRPDPAVITVTPYSDDTDSAASLPPAKPSAAISQAKTAAIPAASKHAARATAAPGFDPDANIVTEETAGRADRLLLSGAQSASTQSTNDGIITRVPSRPGEVPDGTLVKVKLTEELSTLTTVPGSTFSAELSEPVMRDGQVVVPAGSMLQGHVTLVREGKRVGPSAALHLEAETVTLPDGSQYAVEARVIDTDSWDDTKVDHEGTILRKDHGKATAATASFAAGGGMVAGAMMGGLPGALIGAGVGAGVSTVVWMRQDRQADLPKDLGVVFCLTEPMRTTPLAARLTGSGGAGAE